MEIGMLPLIRRLAILLPALTAFIVGSSSAPGATVKPSLLQVHTITFQQGVSPSPDYTGVTDTWLNEWSPLENYGSDPLLYCGRQGSSGRQHVLLRFDLPIIPVNATIISAMLSLYKPFWTVNVQRCDLRPVLPSWDGQIVSWQVRHYEPWLVSRWQAPGCQGAADRGPIVSTYQVAKAPGWVQWPVTSIVREWVTHPDTNRGLLLVATEAAEVIRHTSSEGPAANRPKLTVTYQVQEPDRPPRLAITAPRRWATVQGVTEIQAESSDDQGIARVEFYIGEERSLLGTTTRPPYQIAWDTTSLARQSHRQSTPSPVGLEALARIDQLPYSKDGVQVHQVSSHDPHGRNSDLRNYLYRRGDEYVILDVEGPGCIYNIWFTGLADFSRLRFYLDGEPVPRVDMDVRALFRGDQPPFLAPLVGSELASSGGYYSFLPIPFARSCIVACNGQPWYYHIIYHTYASAEGIQTFTGSEDSSAVRALWERAGQDPKDTAGNLVISGTVSLSPGATATLADIAGAGSIASLKLRPDPATEDILNNARLRIYWDGEAVPSVDAPIGSFFGSGLGERIVRSLLIGMQPGGYYCYFPMPYWESARIELHNGASTSIAALRYEIQYKQIPYERGRAAYFHAQYNNRQLGADGQDYVILQSRGKGHYVGTVLTMTGGTINRPTFLEGDERIYLDCSYSPALYGSGTEDYFLGGWWFRYGTFSLPMHGLPVRRQDAMEHLSCYRLHIGDCIPFSSAIRFGIEHGSSNQEGAYYSSLAYYYQVDVPEAHLTDDLEVGDTVSEAAHVYTTEGEATSVWKSNFYEGDWDDIPLGDWGRIIHQRSLFTLAISPLNRGVQLRRRRDQTIGRQGALVYVDGTLAGPWYTPYQNPIKAWSDETFEIPPSLTAGKEAIVITIDTARTIRDWNEYRYWAYSYDSTVPITVRAYDTAGQVTEQSIRVQIAPPPRVTATPSATPSPTPTPTATNTLSPTPSATATPSPTMTATPSSTPSLTHTPSATATDTPSPTPSATATSSPTATNTFSPTATCSPTPSSTVSATVTATATSYAFHLPLILK